MITGLVIYGVGVATAGLLRADPLRDFRSVRRRALRW